MKVKKTFPVKIIIICFIALLIISGAVYSYRKSMQNLFSNSIRLTLEELAAQQGHVVNIHIASDIVILENIARYVGRDFDPDYDYNDILYEQIAGTNFDNILLCNLDGIAINLDGRSADLSEYAHFQNARDGKTFINSPQLSMLRNAYVTPTATPVFDDEGNVVAVLSAAYVSNNLNELLAPIFGGEGVTYVIDGNGVPIVTNSDYELDLSNGVSLTLFDKFENVEFTEGSLQELKDNIANGKSGYLSYEENGIKYVAEYAPIGANDWYILLSVESETAFIHLKEIQTTTFIISAVIAVVCFCIFGYLLLKLIASQKLLH